MVEVIAPKVGGVSPATGTAISADHALAAAPSVLFDAVAVMASAESARLLTRKAAAVDWVRDAFSHLKVIAFDPEGLAVPRGGAGRQGGRGRPGAAIRR